MTYEILRMPNDEQKLHDTLEGINMFLGAMYSEDEDAVHGPINFNMAHFLFLWDTGGVFLLVKRDDTGNPCLVALCNQYSDLWSNRSRVEIQRLAMLETYDEQKERTELITYLKGVSSLLKFDQLYYNTFYSDGSMFKELVWNGK